MAMDALRSNTFTGSRRNGGGNNANRTPLPPRQNIVGTIVGYEVGDRKTGPNLAADVAILALDHEVPTWGINEITRDAEGRSTTTVRVSLPEKAGTDATKGWDIHSLRWGNAGNGNMASCPAGTIVAFEDTYFLKEGKKNKFTNKDVGEGGLVIAKYISPLARPTQLLGDAAEEILPSRYVLPGQTVMVKDASRNSQDPARSYQETVVSLHEHGSVPVADEASFATAINQALAISQPYSGVATLGVMALVRRDLEGKSPEERLEIATNPDNSMAFEQYADNRRSRVDPQLEGFIVAVSPEGLEAAKAAAPGATVTDVDQAAVLQALGGKDWAKEKIEAEKAAAPVGYHMIKATAEEITAMVGAAYGDMAVYAGPEVSNYQRDGKPVSLGVAYAEGARSIAAGFRRAAGGGSFVESCQGEGFTVELVPTIQYKHLPSVTPGHPENKRGRDDSHAYAIYERVGDDFAGDTVELPDGTRAGQNSRGFASSNVGLQASGSSWQGRYQKPVSAQPQLMKPDELVTGNTAPEFADAFAARMSDRTALQGQVREAIFARAAARREATANAQTAPAPAA